MLVPAGTSPFRDEPVPQMDGSYRQRKNCMAASAACNIGRSTVGRMRRSGAQIRSASGITYDRGLTMAETVTAASRSTGGAVKPEAFYALPNGDFRAIIDAGHSAIYLIDCSATVRIPHCRTNWYTGPHGISVLDSRKVDQPAGKCLCEKAGTAAGNVDHVEFLIEDPGTTTARYKWWSAEIIYKAGQDFSNGNGLYFVAFPDTEGVDRKCRATGYVRKAATTASSRLAPLGVGQMYHVLRTVNGQAWKRANGTTAYGWHVVRLNDGRIGHVRGDKLAVTNA